MQTFIKWVVLIVGFLGSVASIIGVVFSLCSAEISSVVLLGCLCAFLVSILILNGYGVFQFVKKENEKPYKKISIFATFETCDDTHSNYETYRVIQSKRLALTYFDHEFKWSGTKPPVISSDIQTKGKYTQNDATEYDVVRLHFKKPLIFNDTATVHFKAELDDVDHVAKPFLEFKVDTPINLILYKIILKNKPADFNEAATLYQKPIDAHVGEYKPICTVPFDTITKTYQYPLIDPTVGYFYKLEWKK